MSLVCKVARRICFGDEVTVVTSFKELSSKLSSASIERGFGRTDKS